jgi:RNA polymerase sigma factor for flagellar operon FliA
MTDDLVTGNLAIVKTVAWQVRRRIPRHSIATYDDLVQYGTLGLIAASRRYNPKTGVPFAKYCRQRVEGAIIDGLRATDHLSRDQRKRSKETPFGILCQLNEGMPSLDATPEELARSTQRYQALRLACATLNPRDRLIIRLYYAHGRTMKDIGVIIGVNESRVSQLHSRALKQIKQSLAGRVL